MAIILRAPCPCIGGFIVISPDFCDIVEAPDVPIFMLLDAANGIEGVSWSAMISAQYKIYCVSVGRGTTTSSQDGFSFTEKLELNFDK